MNLWNMIQRFRGLEIMRSGQELLLPEKLAGRASE